MDKRYLLFGYVDYYPSGGLNDLIASYDTIEEAVKVAKEEQQEYYEIYDRIAGKRICLKSFDLPEYKAPI